MPLKVVTYNLLAPSHTHPERYPYADAAILSAGRRAECVRVQLLAFDADVYCLQEVEAPWLELFCNALEPRGYAVNFAQKVGGKLDGCATFLRSRLLRERHVSRLFYGDSIASEPPTGCLALVVFAEWHGMTLAIANTHLKWDAADSPPQFRRGVRQVRQLLAERDSLSPPNAGWKADQWVICGDFNCDAKSPVGTELSQAGFQRAAGNQPTMFAPASTYYTAPIDHIYVSSGLTISAATVAQLPLDLPLPNHEHPSDHLPVWAQIDLT